MSNYLSAFAEDLENMIEMKTALGYKKSTFIDRAHKFDEFCLKNFPEESVLSEAIVLTWIKEKMGKGSSAAHARAAFVRGLAKYQNAIGKNAYMLSDKFATGHNAFIPYLMTDNELSEFFKVADTVEKKSDILWEPTISTYFRLTYTCGLRPGEGRKLKTENVDFSTGEIQIIDSKWHKSRTVVMSEDMLVLMKKYAFIRKNHRPDSEYFFPSPSGGPYTSGQFGTVFKKIFAISKSDVPKEFLPSIRVYDLRHRFATANISMWLDQKLDISSRLPYLQTYMGHRDIEATGYYIHLLPENLVKSTGIDWETLNRMVPRAELWEK